ncbi:hypothetical protein SGFS_000570 [Streptomyces graminofaciens]|uniref:Uncharacterized protein n=2 Tax=Streptomyces graminofaciens TaxID=68212 RepID=A0ABN5V5S9_9ACTN|nr:hypothetical protein SGFS_000570 [Streptomyces graminofaciens]
MIRRMESRWVFGDCRLGCQSTGVLVTWLGPVQWDGQHSPFMTCGPCLSRLRAQAEQYFIKRQPAAA